MNKTVSVIIALILIAGIVYVVTRQPVKNSSSTQVLQNVEVKEGIQYVTIDAKGGYSPRISTAKAGIPTKLIVKTDGTYDCSSSLVINEINYKKILPQTGETEIDLGTKNAGETLQGLCGMGMYNFQVRFE